MSDPTLISIADLEKNKFRDTGATPKDVAVAVVNPDGTSIGTGGGGSGSIGVIDNSGVQYSKLISTTATEVNFSGTNLTDRTLLTITNISDTENIYWGFNSSVTVANGTPLLPLEQLAFSIGDTLSIWMIVASGTVEVRVTEAY